MKEQRNLQLQRENVAAQLQLLKAQVHPHFLFNTLNNIYSYTQSTSATASKLVMGLSDLLRYMLYECNQPLVPLNKELKMLQDYIVLEQIRYNHQLDITVDLPDDAYNYMIAPLLLLPFVENAFKHGTSQMLEQPWISLSIFIEEDQLKMKLVNGKAEQQKASTGGIGIANVRKRLELLYPDQHLLKTSNEEHVFVVSLKLQLERNLQPKETRPVAVMTHD
jgi:LytS/YehU family sensor histidine kinase